MAKKISGRQAAKQAVKAVSIAATAKQPSTRDSKGAVKERDKTGKAAAVATRAKIQADAKKEPKGSAARANVGKPWTDSEDERLKVLVAEGKSHEAIAEEFGRTVAGVEARIEKLGIFKAPEASQDKPGNGKHAVTVAQLAASATKDGEQTKEPESEALAPAQSIDLPIAFLTAALSIAPKDDTRYYLNGVFVHQTEEKELRLIATDGHRLFVCSIPQERRTDWASEGTILPREELERIVKYVGKKGSPHQEIPAIRVEYGVKHPTATVHEIDGMAVFRIKPIDGKFPDYQRVIDSAAAVFTEEREELSATTIDSKYLKAAGALSAQLGSKGVIPFLAAQDSGAPSVFAFADVPEALLYIMGQRTREQVLPAPTVKLFGVDAMRSTIAKLEAAAQKSREVAARCKRDHFRETSTKRAERLQARADQLRATIAVKLGCTPEEVKPAAAPDADNAAGVAVH